MSVKVLGYSERGMIAALCADIGRSPDPLRLIESLVSLIQFPQLAGPSPFQGITEAEILVEQSFSTFGDPDLVFLLRTKDGGKHAVFVEAKVHTDVRAGRGIEQRWQFFENCIDCEATRRPSGLFTQMYRSQRLIQRLRTGKDLEGKKKFFGGTKLGKNRVVEKACLEVGKHLADDGQGWVVALLPESEASVDAFFRNDLKQYSADPQQLPGWDIQRWGFLTWEQVDTLCLANRSQWPQTVASFDWNHEQIYIGRRDRKDPHPKG